MTLIAFHMRRLTLAYLLLPLLALSFVFAFRPGAYVTLTNENGTSRQPWVWVDAPMRTLKGQFSGSLYGSGNQVLQVRNTAGAQIRLIIDGKEEYAGITSAQVALNKAGEESNSPVQFTFEYALDTVFPARGEVGLDVENWRYSDNVASQFTPFATYALVLAGILIAALALSSLRLPRTYWLLLIGIFLLGLAARLLIFSEKVANDPTLWTMDKIWDNYILMSRDWLSGRIQAGGNIYQQGPIIYMGVLQTLLGPSMPPLYIFNILLGCLAPPLAVLTGWLLFGKWEGMLAGVALALYAPFIHYQQNLQDTPVVIVCVAVFLFGTAAYFRTRRLLFGIIAGAALGLSAVFRTSTLFLLPIPCLLALWFDGRLPSRFGRVLIIVAAAFLLIMPVTFANLRAGSRSLTATLADYQLFRSNNINSTGLNTDATLSERLALARKANWTQALREDIARAPLRLLELTARRVALFWDPVEHADSAMLDYIDTGLRVSPTLNALALGGAVNFRWVMVMAVAGIILGATSKPHRAATLILAGGLLLFIASLAAFYVIARVRMPLTEIAILLAAVGVTRSVALLRERRILRTAAPFAVSAALAFGMNFAADHLPRPNFISEPPAARAVLRANFDNKIELLGYGYYDTKYQPGGYLTFELYWRSLATLDRDYILTLRYVDHATGAVEDVQNVQIGMTGAPYSPTSGWPSSATYYERYLFALPQREGVYDLYAGVYDTQSKSVLAVVQADRAVQADHVRLTGVQIDTSAVQSAPATNPAVSIWGNALRLEAAVCTLSDGDARVRLRWTVTGHAPTDMTLFTHIVRDDTLLAQQDAPPALVPLDALPPGAEFETMREFPGVSGPLVLRFGLYDFAQQRWPLSQRGPDARPGDYIQIACQ